MIRPVREAWMDHGAWYFGLPAMTPTVTPAPHHLGAYDQRS